MDAFIRIMCQIVSGIFAFNSLTQTSYENYGKATVSALLAILFALYWIAHKLPVPVGNDKV